MSGVVPLVKGFDLSVRMMPPIVPKMASTARGVLVKNLRADTLVAQMHRGRAVRGGAATVWDWKKRA